MTTKTTTLKIMDDWQKMIDAAPDEPQVIRGAARAYRGIMPSTDLPKRYRDEWTRPDDLGWNDFFRKVSGKVESGGIVALIGQRGTGKTRMAAESIRNYAPEKALYTTAMGLFLRIRASFGKTSKESEADIVKELTQTPLLVLDEIQERGNTPWEDRLLTHILDRRYGAMSPTIIIANLTESALVDCLGESIIDRLTENGGILEFKGDSHRQPKP